MSFSWRLGGTTEAILGSAKYRHAPSRHRGSQKKTVPEKRSSLLPGMGERPLASCFRGGESITPPDPLVPERRVRSGYSCWSSSLAQSQYLIQIQRYPMLPLSLLGGSCRR